LTDTQKSNSVRVAVVGCGRIAGHHCRSIHAADGASIVAVCDLDTEKAQEYGDSFGIPVFDSYRRMLETMSGIDVVVIATPSGMHYEHAIEIMEQYGKHVVVEKPTFMRPGQFKSAEGTARKCGVNLYPVFQNRYNKAVDRVRRALRDGELGELRTASVRLRWCRPQRYYDLAPWRGTFSHDGGALTNQTIHHVDLLRHLGGEVARVNAVMRTLGADIEVEDTTVATIEYQSGAVATLESTTAARPDDFEASISLVCSEGLAQIGGIAVNELQIFSPDPSECVAHSEDFVGIKGHGAVYGYGHFAMYRDIVGHLVDGVSYPVSHDDALATLRLLHGFYRADEAGSWVTLDGNDESVRLGRPDEAISGLYRTPRSNADSI
jgi:predicted dehydrogenase